jgi:hypothetical protein
VKPKHTTNKAVNRSGEVRRFLDGTSFVAARLRQAFAGKIDCQPMLRINPYTAPESPARLGAKSGALQLVKKAFLAFVAIASFLALLHPWYSCHIYVPIRHPNYLSIDNRSAFWAIRVGDLGGVHGFDAAFARSEPVRVKLINDHKPFPVNWIVDWSFRTSVISSQGPYLLLVTPLSFPIAGLSAWLISCGLRARKKIESRSSSLSACVPSKTEGEQNAEPELPITGF